MARGQVNVPVQKPELVELPVMLVQRWLKYETASGVREKMLACITSRRLLLGCSGLRVKTYRFYMQVGDRKLMCSIPQFATMFGLCINTGRQEGNCWYCLELENIYLHTVRDR